MNMIHVELYMTDDLNDNKSADDLFYDVIYGLKNDLVMEIALGDINWYKPYYPTYKKTKLSIDVVLGQSRYNGVVIGEHTRYRIILAETAEKNNKHRFYTLEITMTQLANNISISPMGMFITHETVMSFITLIEDCSGISIYDYNSSNMFI